MKKNCALLDDLALALAGGTPLQAWCDTRGLSVHTVSKWLRDPRFRIASERLRGQLLERGAAKLLGALDGVADEIIAMTRDGEGVSSSCSTEDAAEIATYRIFGNRIRPPRTHRRHLRYRAARPASAPGSLCRPRHGPRPARPQFAPPPAPGVARGRA